MAKEEVFLVWLLNRGADLLENPRLLGRLDFDDCSLFVLWAVRSFELPDVGLLQDTDILGMTLLIHGRSGGALPRRAAVRSSIKDHMITSTLSPAHVSISRV